MRRQGGTESVGDRPSGHRETPVVLCIDVEPDPRVFDPRSPAPFDGFERLLEKLPALRERLSEATGRPAAFTWTLRMDPQMADTYGSAGWLAESQGDTLTELVAAGDELALHTHVWRLNRDLGEWFADFEDPVWGEHCVLMALDAFQASFGRQCRAHRGGDHFLSGAMLGALQSQGVSVDLTVEPGLPALGLPEGETARGVTPDYRSVPGRPYRSSPSRFPQADPEADRDPLLVPLMSVRRRRPPFRRVPLPPWENPDAWRPRHIKASPIIAFAVRTDFVLKESLWDRIEANFEHLAHYPGMVFKRASVAVETDSKPLEARSRQGHS